jgi:hypothetical protein
LTLFFAFSLYAQEQAGGISENADTVYVIRQIEFDIDGRTRPYALIYNGEFREGERIMGKDNLDRYLARKQQLLLNERVLEDVTIEYFPGDREEDGALPLTLLVHVKDTWNLVILPYPKYDSNEGFSITLKARDYNFLGTMSALRMDLGYSQENGDNTIGFSIESGTHFQAAALNWNLVFDNFFSYTFEEPLFYQNMTGISLELPWRLTTFTVGLNQYLTINEGNSDEDREIYDLSDRYYGLYGSTEPYVSWKIPFGIEIGDFGELAYTPRISGRINYPYGNMDEPRKPVTTFSHSFGFGGINWIGNYRKGLSVSIGNEYNWYFDRSDAPLKIMLDGDITLHWPFTEYIGVSSRFKYRQWWHRSDRIDDWIPYYNAGDMIRGILNTDVQAYQMLSLNMDLPIRVLRFWPSEWFVNPKLHIIDFELHASPFTALALLDGPNSKIKPDDMIYTTGLEVVVFPGFFRSMNIRASFGYNINKIVKDGPSLRWGFFPECDEIFIGLEHHY